MIYSIANSRLGTTTDVWYIQHVLCSSSKENDLSNNLAAMRLVKSTESKVEDQCGMENKKIWLDDRVVLVKGL